MVGGLQRDQGLVLVDVHAAGVRLVLQRVAVGVGGRGLDGQFAAAGDGGGVAVDVEGGDDRRGVVAGGVAAVGTLDGVVGEPLLAAGQQVEPDAAEVVLLAVVEEGRAEGDAVVAGDAVPGVGVPLGLLLVGGLLGRPLASSGTSHSPAGPASVTM